MNTIKNTIITLLLAVLTLHVGYAADPVVKRELTLTLNPLEEGGVAVLSVRNLVDNKATMTIFNSNEELIFSQSFKDSPVVLEKLNFSRLMPGVYTMEVVSKNQSVSQSFKIGSQGDVTVEEDATSELFQPYVVKKNKEVFVRFYNNAEEEIFVNIYDNQDNLIHQEFEGNSDVFGRRYRFEKIEGGVYRVEIKAGKKEFEKEIKL